MLSKTYKLIMETALWAVIAGSLAVMHINEHDPAVLPVFLREHVSNLPQEIYPIFYGLVVGFLISRPLYALTKKSLLTGRLIVATSVVLIISLRFIDFPQIEGYESRIGALFLLFYLARISLLHVLHEIDLREKATP